MFYGIGPLYKMFKSEFIGNSKVSVVKCPGLCTCKLSVGRDLENCFYGAWISLEDSDVHASSLAFIVPV